MPKGFVGAVVKTVLRFIVSMGALLIMQPVAGKMREMWFPEGLDGGVVLIIVVVLAIAAIGWTSVPIIDYFSEEDANQNYEE